MSAGADAPAAPGSLPSAAMTSTTSRSARLCLWGGLIGAAQAVVLLLLPPAVGPDRFSHPFDATGHVVAQLTFAAQHLLLVAGLVALLRVAGPVSRTTRAALAAAVAGMVLLAVLEVVAAAAAGAAATDPLAVLVGSLYGIPTLLLGVGLAVGGVGIVRAGLWDGWRRWVPFAAGAYVFVALLPGLFGPFWLGRVVIGGWMLLFAALGAALLTPVAGRRTTPARGRPVGPGGADPRREGVSPWR